jgi:hypothetical protein
MNVKSLSNMLNSALGEDGAVFHLTTMVNELVKSLDRLEPILAKGKDKADIIADFGSYRKKLTLMAAKLATFPLSNQDPIDEKGPDVFVPFVLPEYAGNLSLAGMLAKLTSGERAIEKLHSRLDFTSDDLIRMAIDAATNIPVRNYGWHISPHLVPQADFKADEFSKRVSQVVPYWQIELDKLAEAEIKDYDLESVERKVGIRRLLGGAQLEEKLGSVIMSVRQLILRSSQLLGKLEQTIALAQRWQTWLHHASTMSDIPELDKPIVFMGYDSDMLQHLHYLIWTMSTAFVEEPNNPAVRFVNRDHWYTLIFLRAVVDVCISNKVNLAPGSFGEEFGLAVNMIPLLLPLLEEYAMEKGLPWQGQDLSYIYLLHSNFTIAFTVNAQNQEAIAHALTTPHYYGTITVKVGVGNKDDELILTSNGSITKRESKPPYRLKRFDPSDILRYAVGKKTIVAVTLTHTNGEHKLVFNASGYSLGKIEAPMLIYS